jgi:nitrogen-specific signal transduction histidine kinase
LRRPSSPATLQDSDHQVLMNLMLNGIEAIRENGAPGKLTIKSEQAETMHRSWHSAV